MTVEMIERFHEYIDKRGSDWMESALVDEEAEA